MSDRSTHWDNVYATKGEAEVSWFQNTPATSLAMIRAANPDREAGRHPRHWGRRIAAGRCSPAGRISRRRRAGSLRQCA
ncbi:hypothetical protein ACVWW5_000404 [Bradyrhizobium sp. LM3.4]